QRREALDAVRGAYWQEFLRVVEVLEQFDAVHGRELLPKGRLIASLRHDNELMVADLVWRGALIDLNVAETAALCSTLIEEARSREPMIARGFLKKQPRLRRRFEQIAAAADAIDKAQRARRLGMSTAVHAGFMPAVYRWASGHDDWSRIVEESFGGHEGD